jgi:hypothetical protein
MLAFSIALETRGTKSIGTRTTCFLSTRRYPRGNTNASSRKHGEGGGEPKEIQGRQKALVARGAFAQSFDKGSQLARRAACSIATQNTWRCMKSFRKPRNIPPKPLASQRTTNAFHAISTTTHFHATTNASRDTLSQHY